MATPQQIQALKDMYEAAKQANHKWPAASACEAMIETGWLQHVPRNSFNVLGIKAYRGWDGPVVAANGTEQNKDGSWTGPQSDKWCVFPSYAACFEEQMKILQEPRYLAAMEAPTIESYIVTESSIWSTGIEKGKSVLATYNAHKDIF